MKNIKRAAIFFIAMLLIFTATAKIAFAKSYNFEDLDLTLEVPEDVFVLTKDTPSNDPLWGKAGITDVATELKNYEQMGVQAVFVAEDGQSKVTLLKKESSENKEVFNFLSMTEEELNEYLTNLISDDSTEYKSTIEKYSHKQTPFFRMEIKSLDEANPVNELIYGTIINGYSLTFDVYKNTGYITNEEELIKQLVDSVNFTNILDRPEAEELTTKEMVVLVFKLVFLVGIIVAVIIYVKLRRKKEEAFKKEMRDNITDYRIKHKKLEEEGKLLKEEPQFSNYTTYNEDTIMRFCNYNLYTKNIYRFVYSAFLCVAILLWALFNNMSAWIIIGMVVLGILYIYYVSTLAEKAKKKIVKRFSSSKSKVAIHTFYEDHFTISGIQYISDYPYFQITEVREYKGFLYLYFGPDVVYYLSIDGFEKGSIDQFKRFLRERLGNRVKIKE